MNTKKTCLIAGACMATGLTAGVASAQVIYDNGVGGAAGVTSSLIADSSLPQAVADGVVFQPDQTVTGIEWTGVYAGGDTMPPATDNFVITIRDDASGLPGGVIATFPVGSSVARTPVPSGTSVLSNVYDYSAAISFTFISGVEYWIEIENDNGARDDDRWAWCTGPTGTGGTVWFSANLGVNWFDSTFPGTDFRLLATGPLCPADTNGDGLLTPADFSAWILAFNTMSPACDQNGDGACTPQDFNAWILNYNTGC